MDVIFDIPRGRSFSIEVGFFDTVLEIKEKVQKYQSIPISKQTLILNGEVLQDEGDVWKYEILQNSHIKLLISKDPEDTKVHLNIKISMSNFPIEMDKDDTILNLKERIHQMELSDVPFPIPMNKLVLHLKGTQLRDNQFLRDFDVWNYNEIVVSFRETAAAATPTPTLTATTKLTVMVLSKCGKQKIAMEVNPCDNVGELKKELQKLDQFNLPQEGYFFIYKQSVMNDDKSFRWHKVAHGETIEIFNGSVTGGT